jgi:23S rRNA (adenine-N6)-dimethyltransferase
MAEKVKKRITLAQHFFRNPERVRRLVRESGIGPADTVVEIGPGRGMITEVLAEVAGRVIAIEKDVELAAQLKRRFRATPQVTIITGDFLHQRLALTRYKVFANIPFNCTAQMMHKLLAMAPAPQSIDLVMQKEAAQKFAGTPVETQMAVLIKPWFDCTVSYRLQRTDFTPVPSVEIALLHMKQRNPPLIAPDEATLYRRFVTYSFRRGRRTLQLSYEPIFRKTQWRELARRLRFPVDATPSQLRFEQWLGLFMDFQEQGLSSQKGLIAQYQDRGRRPRRKLERRRDRGVQ